MAILGEFRRLSDTTAGSSTNAEFGAVSETVPSVTQSGAGPAALEAVHPAGSDGAVTPSKFSVNTTEVPAQAVPTPPAVPPIAAQHAGSRLTQVPLDRQHLSTGAQT